MSMHVVVHQEVSIGHRLLGYQGKCGFLHGHNYRFEIAVNGKPDAMGLVVDFKDLKKALHDILEPFDHSLVLNEQDPVANVLHKEKLVLLSVNPSAENLASLVFGKLVDRGFSPHHVRVQETEDGWAVAESVDRNVRFVAVQ